MPLLLQNITRKGLVLFTLALVTEVVYAQGPPPPPPPCFPPPCVPINGGIVWLIVAGLAFGARQLYAHKRKKFNKFLSLLIFITVFHSTSKAGGPPPPPGPPSVPVDGGIGWLIAAGTIYGAKKLIGRKSRDR